MVNVCQKHAILRVRMEWYVKMDNVSNPDLRTIV